MREIKFRVWLNGDYFVTAKMIDWETALQEFNAFDIFQSPDKMTPLQFTGLFDKKGLEIYESDIVRVQETMDGGRIVCLEAIASVFWNKERGCWGCEGGFEDHLADYAFGTKLNVMGNVCEVVGNIYENPELLEVEK